MDILLACCAGLDVHKDSVQVCVRALEGSRVGQQTRQWGTATRALMEMTEWLKAESVTHVAMESTGVYWKPIFNVLENDFEVLLVNAHSIKHLPGRKTDVAGCQWIAAAAAWAAAGQLYSAPVAAGFAGPDSSTDASEG